MLEDANALREAVERLHGCKAKLLEAVRVVERFHGAVVWDGVIHVFSIEGHPSAVICYAWSSPVEGSGRRRFYAVLRTPPVVSPADAVRAAIVDDYKEGKPT
ncbi:MAG: hypothetical protein ABR961_01975 [Thermoanaerobaculaceae bacterium]|jgi:hypothetical protein